MSEAREERGATGSLKLLKSVQLGKPAEAPHAALSVKNLFVVLGKKTFTFFRKLTRHRSDDDEYLSKNIFARLPLHSKPIETMSNFCCSPQKKQREASIKLMKEKQFLQAEDESE
jgi:hypothetical protein